MVRGNSAKMVPVVRAFFNHTPSFRKIRCSGIDLWSIPDPYPLEVVKFKPTTVKKKKVKADPSSSGTESDSSNSYDGRGMPIPDPPEKDPDYDPKDPTTFDTRPDQTTHL